MFLRRSHRDLSIATKRYSTAKYFLEISAKRFWVCVRTIRNIFGNFKNPEILKIQNFLEIRNYRNPEIRNYRKAKPQK